MSDIDKALEFSHDRLGRRVDADIKAGDGICTVPVTLAGDGRSGGPPAPIHRPGGY